MILEPGHLRLGFVELLAHELSVVARGLGEHLPGRRHVLASRGQVVPGVDELAQLLVARDRSRSLSWLRSVAGSARSCSTPAYSASSAAIRSSSTGPGYDGEVRRARRSRRRAGNYSDAAGFLALVLRSP